MTDRTALLAGLADEVLAHNPSGRRVLAIDGVDGAGKTTFADALAAVLRDRGVHVVRASVDGFHRPRAERYARGRDSAEGYYRDSFDLEALRALLIEPFGSGAAVVVVAAFDHASDAPVERRESGIPHDAMLVLDGVFLHRPELRGLWHSSVWLDVDDAVREARLTARDGAGSLAARYSEGQAIYAREANPRRAAAIIVDNNDAARPRRVFADFC
ncbi:MAG: uridine kinase [Microcella sp.]|uniref:uridine kinase n=1 Tax=Microcella sp. TaxID=1913979 RepID=UPI0024CB539B|nr:uridine kinase [Microcella sp.]UYN84012.1 MAG: uridine kinase [Microcella sp.]